MGQSRPEPSFADLLDAATRYLSRYAASEAAVARILEGRIARWVRSVQGEPSSVRAQAAAARAAIPAVVARLRAAGVLDDALYAAAKVRRLARSGRSRRMIEAYLAGKGVSGEIRKRAVAADSVDDVLSALLTARRRRLGPFRDTGAKGDLRKDIAVLGRAGFTDDVVRQVLGLSQAEAAVILGQSVRTLDNL